MSANPSPDFCTAYKRDDIEVLAEVLARVPNVPPMRPAFRETVREVARLRGSEPWKCVQFCVAKMHDYDQLWNGIYFDNLAALHEAERMGVSSADLRLASKWLMGVYREVFPSVRLDA
jgi:hypothetical protein